jgi:hypothetical protein
MTTKESFEDNTDLEYVDEVFSVSTEELMISMGVQMCHHNVVGHALNNPNSRLQKIDFCHEEGEGQVVEAQHHPALGVHVCHQREHQQLERSECWSSLSSSSHLLDVVEEEHVDGHEVVSLAPGNYIDSSVGMISRMVFKAQRKSL